MLCESVAVILLLVVLFYVYYTWNNDYWKTHNVPFAKPAFFFGNFKEAFLGRQHFGMKYTELYRNFKDAPFIGIFKLRDPVLLLREPEVIKNVLVENFSCFTDNDFTVDLKKDRIWSTNPFSNKGEVWRNVRARWIPHTSAAKLKLYQPGITESSKNLMEHLNETASIVKNKSHDVREMSSTFFLDFVVIGIFGVKINSFLNPTNIFKRLKDSIFISSFFNGLITTVIVVAPWLGNFIPIRFVTKEMEKMIMTITRDIIKCRKETGTPNTDLYETLQRFSNHDGLKEFSELDLAGRVFGLILDAAETTSSSISFGIYELACNPDVQTKLRREVDNAVQVHGRDLPIEEILKLPYLEMFMQEVLRLYPPLMQISRVCTKDTTIVHNNHKVNVRAGMSLAIPVYGLHTDPNYFPDPFKFDPERFSDETKANIPKFVYIPFGEGPRICSGMKLGQMESKSLFVTLVRYYVLKPTVQLPRPIPFDPNVFVTRSNETLSVSFTQREYLGV